MSLSISRTQPKTNGGSDVVRQRPRQRPPQRVYDHLYDPVYTVSSEVDHKRANLKIYTSKDRIKRVAKFGSMFSELSHYPRFTVQPDLADPVPASIDRRWRGHAEQRREALNQLAGVIPNAQLWLKREEYNVNGADRWKYFKSPLIPFSHQVPPNAILSLPKEDSISFGGKHTEHTKQPSHFTVGIQTDYRESDTQTDPYSPEYVVQPATTPSELLQLAALTWGRGLPAGLAEVEMIERARAKRAWEATLPPFNDLSHLEKRRRMMEEMEVNEWAFRDGEIQKLQEARLIVLKDLLRQRDMAQREVTSKRLLQIYSEHQKDKEIKLHKINNDYKRSLRKLDSKMRNELQQHGIIENYRGIQMCAPRSCRDTFSNKNLCNNELKSHYLNTYEGLLEIEARLFASVPKSQGQRHKSKVKENVINPPVSTEVGLMKKYKALREEENKELAKKSMRFLVKKEKPVPRTITPTVEEPPEANEEIELSVIHLQKLLRGRSIQYKMFKGKQNNLELIRELRTVHALQAEEQELQKADKELVMTLQKQSDKQRHETAKEEAARAGVVGAELEHLFSTLSKELIHLQEERRIHAFSLLAERDRRLREAEESGRRQMEERRRREEDEIFRQVVQVHQETVDLYLEDIILGALEQTADKQAREEIHRDAKEINDIAYDMEKNRNSLQSEEIVSELMYSFLIQEVDRISVQERVHKRQHRHLQAARSIIKETVERPGISHSIPRTSELTCPSERASTRILEELTSQVEQDNGEKTE